MTTTQHVLNAQRVFPIGTSVKAIPQSNWAVNQLPPTADQGSATDTKTVQPDGTLTFTGLTAKTRYFAVATVDSVYRYISFICGDAGDLSAPDAYVTQAQLAAAIAGVGGGAVSSVFGRTGAVAAAEADYGLTQMSDVDLAGQANGNFLKRSSGVWVPAAIAESDVANLVSDLAGKQASLGFTPENVANKDTDVTMAANSDTKYPSQKAAKAYIDAVASGLQVKGSVRLASTANIAGTMVGTVLTVTATGAISIDGVTPSVGDRVLLKDQTTGSQNGVYTVTVVGTTGVSPVLTRATDFIVGVQVQSGDFFFVGEGTASAGAGYVLTTPDPITVGTTSLTFTQFSGAGEITAGTGLSKSGNTLSVPDLGITPRLLSDLARGTGWTPTNAIAETFPRWAIATNAVAAGTSATLQVYGGMVLPGGRAITNINVLSGSVAAATSTHCWFCLIDKNLNVLATTLDDTAASPWAAATVKTLQIATALGGGTPGTYTPTNAIPVYIGICQVATTRANLQGPVTGDVSSVGSAPIIGATSTASLTTPASLGSTAGALTAVGRMAYAYVS